MLLSPRGSFSFYCGKTFFFFEHSQKLDSFFRIWPYGFLLFLPAFSTLNSLFFDSSSDPLIIMAEFFTLKLIPTLVFLGASFPPPCGPLPYLPPFPLQWSRSLHRAILKIASKYTIPLLQCSITIRPQIPPHLLDSYSC